MSDANQATTRLKSIGLGQAAVMAAVVGISGQAEAQIVANGTFSTTANNQLSTYTLTSGATSGNNYLPSWGLNLTTSFNCLVISANITDTCSPGPAPTVAQNPGTPSGGGNFVSLSSASLISQTIVLTGGQLYQLSFLTAGTDPGGTGPGSSATVAWIVNIDGTTVVAAVDDTQTFAPSGFAAWQSNSKTFSVSSSGSHTLTFTASTNQTGGKSPIALVAGISISAVATPEPATLSMFGVGLAGLAAARRRRARQLH